MSQAFEKYHIEGLPFSASLHHFTQPDAEGEPHDHPFDFTSHILHGGYVEQVFRPDGSYGTIERLEGTCHNVKAEHIHRISELPNGECWTLIIPTPHRRVTQFWRIDPVTGCFVSRDWDKVWNDETLHSLGNDAGNTNLRDTPQD